MKKIIVIFALMIILLSACQPEKTKLYMYEVHLSDGSIVEVCADDVTGIINSSMTFLRENKQVAMFPGSGIWFNSTQVETCQ